MDPDPDPQHCPLHFKSVKQLKHIYEGKKPFIKVKECGLVLGFIFVHFMVTTFYIRFRIRTASAGADPVNYYEGIISVPGIKNRMNVYNTE